MARIGADPHDNAPHYCLMPRIGTIFAAGCGDTAEWFHTRGEVARLVQYSLINLVRAVRIFSVPYKFLCIIFTQRILDTCLPLLCITSLWQREREGRPEQLCIGPTLILTTLWPRRRLYNVSSRFNLFAILRKYLWGLLILIHNKKIHLHLHIDRIYLSIHLFDQAWQENKERLPRYYRYVALNFHTLVDCLNSKSFHKHNQWQTRVPNI